MDTKKTNSNSQEVVEVNSVTEKILKRYGYQDTPSQESAQKGDEINESLSANASGKQDENSMQENLQLTDEQVNSLIDSGVELEGKTIEEIQALVKDSNQEQVNTQDQIIITEAMASNFGFAKNLIGKPLDEAFKALDEQNAYITQLQKGKQQKQSDASQSNSTTNKQTQDDLVEEIEALDLVNLTPKEQAEYILKLAKKVNAQKEPEQLEETVNEEVQELTADEQKALVEEYRQTFISTLQTKLPEKVDAMTVFNEWKKTEGKNLTPELKVAYANNPNHFITVIMKDYNLRNGKSIDESKRLAGEERVKQAENIKKAFALMKQAGTGAKFNFPREGKVKNNSLDSKEGSSEEVMIGSILSRNLPRG